MSAAVRFFVAVWDGHVVGSRSSLRRYSHAVVYHGAAGAFATFHSDEAHARDAALLFFGGKGIVTRTFETTRRMQVGEPFADGQPHDIEAVQ